jgi:hypothetical protein
MPSATRRLLIWLVVIVVLILLYLTLPGTHPPPFDRIGGATPEQLAATCNDPKLHFLRIFGSEAEVDSGIRVRLTPEFFSFRNDSADLEQGRVVALVQVRRGTGYPRWGLKDTAAACLFISGKFPKHLTTSIISKEGELLVDSIKIETRVVRKRHLLPEAHWEADWPPDTLPSEGFNFGPRPLFAESPERAGLASARAAWWMKIVFKTYGQTSCTNHSCCVSSGGR